MSSPVVTVVIRWRDQTVTRAVLRSAAVSLLALVKEAFPNTLPPAYHMHIADLRVPDDWPLSRLFAELAVQSTLVVDVVAIEPLPPQPSVPRKGLPKSEPDSDVRLGAPSDSGISLETAEDDSPSFELTLDASPAASRAADSESEFELSLDDSGDASGVDLGSEADHGEVDIFETDFDVPAMEDDEAAAPAVESSDFEVERIEIEEEEESGSQVVALDEECDEDMDAACLDDDEELEEAPARKRADPAAAAQKPRKLTDRHATVRYYSQMNPNRVYPLLVILSKKEIQEVRKRHVKQAASGPLKVDAELPLVVEPILPGFACQPHREQLRISEDDVTLTFWVVPQVLGKIEGARVVLRQGDEVLTSLPLEMRVVNTTLTSVMGLSTFALPFASSLLKHYKLDFESQLEAGFGSYLGVIQWLLMSLPPEVLLLVLLAATALSYLWLRPRQRDVFWDVGKLEPQPATPGPGRLAMGMRFAGRVTVVGAVVGAAVGLALFAAAAVRFPVEEAARKMAFVLWFLPALGAVGGLVVGFLAGLFREDAGE